MLIGDLKSNATLTHLKYNYTTTDQDIVKEGGLSWLLFGVLKNLLLHN